MINKLLIKNNLLPACKKKKTTIKIEKMIKQAAFKMLPNTILIKTHEIIKSLTTFQPQS